MRQRDSGETERQRATEPPRETETERLKRREEKRKLFIYEGNR